MVAAAWAAVLVDILQIQPIAICIADFAPLVPAEYFRRNSKFRLGEYRLEEGGPNDRSVGTH